MFADCISDIVREVNSVEVTTASSLYKLILSLLLGSIVGFERKRKGQSAGVRTFALISMGATLAMILSIYVPQEYLGLKNGDPGRIAAQVLSGIGFLGAGAIIQMKGSVRGLTTAAGIWMVATIGLAVGVGLYVLSFIATLLIMFILVIIENIEHKINVGSSSRIIRIKVDEIVEDINEYRKILAKYNIPLVNVFVDYNYAEKSTSLNLVVLVKDATDYIAVFKDLSSVHSTRSITLANQISI
ncbi:MAG: MgtC/SapB family protein [Bacteroides sp.]|nr:MgtC/SapB family protein [Bacteroides sp.]